MQRFFILFFLSILLIILFVNLSFCQDDLKIWNEFIVTLKKGDFPSQKIRPYYESLREPVLGYLKNIHEQTIWQEWEQEPEFHRVGNQLHYLLPLTFGDDHRSYCFSFVIEDDNWYFQHLEAITIRLDKLGSLPASEFPDLPEDRKTWMREEIRISDQVRLFNFLSQEKGKEFAFNWFKDGYGYALAARAWVPFFPQLEAFILYLCWEQSRLRGEDVTLEKLDKNEAVVRIKPQYFVLYQVAAHLKQKISYEDYKTLFETIWQDRAEKAGWTLQIDYREDECVFCFKKLQLDY